MQLHDSTGAKQSRFAEKSHTRENEEYETYAENSALLLFLLEKIIK